MELDGVTGAVEYPGTEAGILEGGFDIIALKVGEDD